MHTDLRNCLLAKINDVSRIKQLLTLEINDSLHVTSRQFQNENLQIHNNFAFALKFFNCSSITLLENKSTKIHLKVEVPRTNS